MKVPRIYYWKPPFWRNWGVGPERDKNNISYFVIKTPLINVIFSSQGGGGSFRSSLKLKARHGKKGEVKPYHITKVEDNFFWDAGMWTKREVIADRENDLYHEIVTDRKTGRILYENKEPLKNHKGH